MGCLFWPALGSAGLTPLTHFAASLEVHGDRVELAPNDLERDDYSERSLLAKEPAPRGQRLEGRWQGN